MKFKKFLYGLIAVAVAMGMLTTTLYIERSQNVAVAANAGETIEIADSNNATGTFRYEVNSDGDTVTLTGYNDSADYRPTGFTIDIPSTVTDSNGKEYTVTEIGSENGYYSSVLPYGCRAETITIPNTVTKINNSAFYYAQYLRSITIPGSVKIIGNSAFASCYALSNVTISDGVERIDGSAFTGCGMLTSINIPGSVKSIGMYAFSNCTMLKTVTIQNGVESIEELAFSSTPITSIIIPNSVTNISGGAFQSSMLESVTIPGSVNTMGIGIFSQCYSLKNVIIEEGVKTIPTNMFAMCSILETISIPNSVVSICDGAFMSCPQLKSVKIPESVDSIGQRAFNSSGLTSVTIPKSVRTIGDNAFSNCRNLRKANIPANIVVLGDDAFPATQTEITFDGTQAQWDKLGLEVRRNPYDPSQITGNGYLLNVTIAGGEGTPIDNSLPAPTGLSYVSVSERDVQISWQPVAGASKYIFMYRKYISGPDPHMYSNWYMNYIPSNSIDEYGNVTIELRGLVRNTQYVLTVAAISADGTVGELYHNPDGSHFKFEADYDPTYRPPTNNSAPIIDNETFEDPGLSSFQPQIIVNKVDSETQAPLAGAEFSIYTDKACTKLLKSQTTGANGEAVFSISIDEWLKYQMYYIKETKAPSGYKISDQVVKAEFDADKAQRGKIAAFYTNDPDAVPSDTTPPVFENEKGSDPDSSSTPTPPPTSSDPGSSEPESSESETSKPDSSEPNSSDSGTSDPESSNPGTSEPDNSRPESIPSNPPTNPPTGSALAFLVPAVLASGAMVIAALKRRK
ncbi:MAG: leucine-rich repeat protein [Ruminococcaceae bacterium]|nr:leucine-rich repeat protein [Oscillospiraceae bacterium]